MAAELALPASRAESRKSPEARAGDSEFPIRAHHLPIYRELLTHLIASPKGDLFKTLNRFTKLHARSMQNDTTFDEVNYREHFGESKDDDTLPCSYPEDLMKDSLEGYTSRLWSPYRKFLILPDTTTVTVGPVIDEICQSCFFHRGKGGGLHCQTVLMPGENEKAHKMKGLINTYLQQVPERPQKDFYPDFVRAQEVSAALPLTGKTYEGRSRNVAEQFTVPLGLIRDTLVYDITRKRFMNFEEGADTIYYSFEEWLRAI